MNRYQKQIKKFCKDRNWEQFHNPKDLLLGVVEEIGEFRNIIKWEQDPKIIKESLLKNKNEVRVDMNEAIKEVIKENEKRFPLSKTKNKHTNIHLGGHDGKYSKIKAS